MSDFFRIIRGLEVDESVQVLQGSGSPTNTDTDAAPVGSLYLDTLANVDKLNTWYKHTAGTGVDKWAVIASKDYVDAAASGISWREPVEVIDKISTTTGAITTDLDADDLIQGVAVTGGMRILGSNVTGNKNIFIVGGSSGSWILTEDDNTETQGDTVYVTGGTYAGQTYIYNGTNWVLMDQASSDELGYIRTFIGKNAAGSESPSYSSITQLSAQGVSLETAIGDLDASIGTDPTTNTIISSSNTVNANVLALGNFVEKNGKVTSATNITSATVIDGIQTTMAKWLVRCVVNGDSTRVRAYEVFATHNGVSVDYTRYATLALGTAPTGLVVEATLSGGNTLNIRVTSTTAVDVTVKRVAAV